MKLTPAGATRPTTIIAPAPTVTRFFPVIKNCKIQPTLFVKAAFVRFFHFYYVLTIFQGGTNET